MRHGIFNFCLAFGFLLVLNLSCGNFQQFFNANYFQYKLAIKIEKDADREVVLTEVERILKQRIEFLGVNAKMQRGEADNFIINLYGTLSNDEIERFKRVLSASSKFELRAVTTPKSPAPLQIFPSPEAASRALVGNQQVAELIKRGDDDFQFLIVAGESIVNGLDVRRADAIESYGANDNYSISFSLKPNAAVRFGNWTGANINSYLAVMFNDKVYSAPYIRSQIFDEGVIDGRFTKAEAEDLALILNSGYLPAKLEFLSEKLIEAGK